MAADLVTILETVTVTQLLTPTGKALGETILERGKQMAGKAVAYLAAVGRQPQVVAEKLLVPMALGAGLENEPTLSDHWAALLANAADPTQQVVVQPAFAEILKQLTPSEALLLNKLFDAADILKNAINLSPEGMHPDLRKARTLDFKIDFMHMRDAFLEQAEESKHSVSELGEINRFDSMMDNLLRQRLVIPAKTSPFPQAETSGSNLRPDTNRVFFSSLGYDFVLAVTPPAP